MLGKMIGSLRKDAGMTQEQLAKLLDVTNQAVSKWETDQCCPDVAVLPKLADIFGVTIDELFGREAEQKQEFHLDALPWENDEALHVVVFRGHEMLGATDPKNAESVFRYAGAALEIHSNCSVSCGAVSGGITAAAYVECGAVAGNVTAGDYVECASVVGNVKADGYVECDDVSGNVTSGGYVECAEVGGSVEAGQYVECGDVGTNVKAGGYVECGDVGGSVEAGQYVECGDVGANLKAGGYVECGDVTGNVESGDYVECDRVGGKVTAEKQKEDPEETDKVQITVNGKKIKWNPFK